LVAVRAIRFVAPVETPIDSGVSTGYGPSLWPCPAKIAAYTYLKDGDLSRKGLRDYSTAEE